MYIYIYDIRSLRGNDLTIILLTWRKWWANNASKWQMGFNSGFKALKQKRSIHFLLLVFCHQIRTYLIHLTLFHIFIHEIFSRLFVVATAKDLTTKLSDESNDSNRELDTMCSNKNYLSNILYIWVTNALASIKQSGAVEACWAHNPEVRGSKPRSAMWYFFFKHICWCENMRYSWQVICRPNFRNFAHIEPGHAKWKWPV